MNLLESGVFPLAHFHSAWPDFLSLTLGQLCAFEAKNEIGESKVSPAVSERFIVRKLAPRLSPNGTVSGSSGHPSPLSLSLSDDVTQPILLSRSFLMFLFLCFSLEGLDAPDAVGVRRILLQSSTTLPSSGGKKSEACRTKKGNSVFT